MALGLTKPAQDVYAPTTTGGAQRGAVMGEAQRWGMEIEATLDAAIVAGLSFQGAWDASGGSFPGSGAAVKGQAWAATVAGTVGGIAFAVGDLVIALVNSASTSTYAANWIKFAPTKGDTGDPGEAGAGFSPEGAYDDATTYATNDYVSFGGRTFISIVDDNLGNEPPSADADDAYWMWVPTVVGPQGPQGEQGIQGVQGETGEQGPPGADGEGTGDVVGPASAVTTRIAVFDGTSGKLIADGGKTIAGIEASAANIAASTNSAAGKTTPVDADLLPLIDSADSNALKKLSLTNLWAWAKAKADTFYQALDAQLSSLIRQNSQSAAYTLVLTDGGKHIFHPSADTTARTWTIPENASVAYPIGTAISFINQNGAGVITIAITTDTMRLAGAGTTGSRTLAANGIATAVKVTSTEWIISGSGLT